MIAVNFALCGGRHPGWSAGCGGPSGRPNRLRPRPSSRGAPGALIRPGRLNRASPGGAAFEQVQAGWLVEGQHRVLASQNCGIAAATQLLVGLPGCGVEQLHRPADFARAATHLGARLIEAKVGLSTWPDPGGWACCPSSACRAITQASWASDPPMTIGDAGAVSVWVHNASVRVKNRPATVTESGPATDG